jgi:hypothetical protein
LRAAPPVSPGDMGFVSFAPADVTVPVGRYLPGQLQTNAL